MDHARMLFDEHHSELQASQAFQSTKQEAHISNLYSRPMRRVVNNLTDGRSVDGSVQSEYESAISAKRAKILALC